MCPSKYNRFWDTAIYLWKNRHFIIQPCIRRPRYGGFSSEYRHPLWYGKTRMVSLPDGEKISKISLFVLAQLTNVTDRQTDGRTPGNGNSRAMHNIARRKSAISCACKVLKANVVFETLLRRNSTCSVNVKVELATTPSTVSRFSLVMVEIWGGRGSLVSLKCGEVKIMSVDFDTLSFRLLDLAQSQISLCKRCKLTDGTLDENTLDMQPSESRSLA